MRAKSSTKVIGGQKFTVKSCSNSKSKAKKAAEDIKSNGYNYRIQSTNGRHCVLQGRKSKRRGKRK